MTDDTNPIEQLAKSYAKLERAYRWPLITVAIVIPASGLSSAAVSLLRGSPWGVVDAIRFGVLTMLGLVACYGATTIYRVWKRQNAEIVGLYRQLTAMSEMVEGWKPLFAYIEHAHRQGYVAVIAPGDEYELPPEKLN